MKHILIPIPTLRVEFKKQKSVENFEELTDIAHEHDCIIATCTPKRNNKIKEAIFVFEKPEKLAEFKDSIITEECKVKSAAITVSYTENKMFRKLLLLAILFGANFEYGELADETDPGLITISFWSNYMCKAYSVCMNYL